MHSWRQFMAYGLVVCLLQFTMVDLTFSAEATSAATPALVKRTLDQLGAGAKVKITLTSGKKLKGTVQAVDEEAFLLTSGRQGSSQRIAYDQVAELRLAKLTYKAAGQTDPIEVKRLAVGLGVGKHIMVKTAAKQEFHGNIQSLGEDYLTVLPDHEPAPVQIAYADVRQMGPNLSTGEKILIGVGVGAAVIIAVILIWAVSSSD
jgi:ribosome maturation factor RimP